MNPENQIEAAACCRDGLGPRPLTFPGVLLGWNIPRVGAAQGTPRSREGLLRLPWRGVAPESEPSGASEGLPGESTNGRQGSSEINAPALPVFAHEGPAPARRSRFRRGPRPAAAPFIERHPAARRREKIVARSDEDRQDFLRKRGFSNAETGRIVETVLTEEGRPPESVFDFVQGITAVARSKPQQEYAALIMEGNERLLLEKGTEHDHYVTQLL